MSSCCRRCLRRHTESECITRIPHNSAAHKQLKRSQQQLANNSGSYSHGSYSTSPDTSSESVSRRLKKGSHSHSSRADSGPSASTPDDTQQIITLANVSEEQEQLELSQSLLQNTVRNSLNDAVINSIHLHYVMSLSAPGAWADFYRRMTNNSAILNAYRAVDPYLAAARRFHTWSYVESPEVPQADDPNNPTPHWPQLTITRTSMTFNIGSTDTSSPNCKRFAFSMTGLHGLRHAVLDPKYDVLLADRQVTVNERFVKEFGISQAAVKAIFVKYPVMGLFKIISTAHVTHDTLGQLLMYMLFVAPRVGPHDTQYSISCLVHVDNPDNPNERMSPRIMTHRQTLSGDNATFVNTFTFSPVLPAGKVGYGMQEVFIPNPAQQQTEPEYRNLKLRHVTKLCAL